MTVPGRLRVGDGGKLIGPAVIQYNDPWPCKNGQGPGVTGAMMGVVMHTEVGYEQPTIQWFNNPASQASAFFAIGRNGAIHQFFPLGQGYMAWTQSAGNLTWYGIEDADRTHPSIPLTDAQVTAFAQIYECLSAFAGFPLQVSDSVNVKGLGWHGMGGLEWGGHFDCPGDVRKAQRPAIVELARQIRAGGGAQVSDVPAPAEADQIAALEAELARLKGASQPAPAAPKPHRIRNAAAAVHSGMGRAAGASAHAIKAEPAMSAGITAAALSAGVLAQHHLGLHIDATWLKAILTAIPAVAAVVGAVLGRPVRKSVLTGAAGAIATAAAAFGLHISPSVLSALIPAAALIVAAVTGGAITPKPPTGGSAPVGSA